MPFYIVAVMHLNAKQIEIDISLFHSKPFTAETKCSALSCDWKVRIWDVSRMAFWHVNFFVLCTERKFNWMNRLDEVVHLTKICISLMDQLSCYATRCDGARRDIFTFVLHGNARHRELCETSISRKHYSFKVGGGEARGLHITFKISPNIWFHEGYWSRYYSTRNSIACASTSILVFFFLCKFCQQKIIVTYLFISNVDTNRNKRTNDNFFFRFFTFHSWASICMQME